MESTKQNVEQIDTTSAISKETVVFDDNATNRLISVELSKLMPLITDDLSNSEDITYLNAALSCACKAKEFLRTKDYGNAAKFANRACKRIGELVGIRKEKQPDYSLLEAPFYYLQGHILFTYIENSADVFGNYPPLPEVVDSEEEEECDGDEDENGEEEAGHDEEVKNGEEAKGDDEPRIEEEKKVDTLKMDGD